MKKILIVDIDETLVWSRSRVPFEGCTTFTDLDDGYVCHTIARPGAKEFLEYFSNKDDYEIISVTQGVVPFQIQVLKNLQLFRYFMDDYMTGKSVLDHSKHQIYGWTTSRRTDIVSPKEILNGSKWVMVDNLDHRDLTLREKMNWIGAEFDPEKNFVQCECFYGLMDPNPQDLRELIPRIELLMERE